jgi:hypothetical protein
VAAATPWGALDKACCVFIASMRCASASAICQPSRIAALSLSSEGVDKVAGGGIRWGSSLTDQPVSKHVRMNHRIASGPQRHAEQAFKQIERQSASNCSGGTGV